jgi:hypothetical protein
MMTLQFCIFQALLDESNGEGEGVAAGAEEERCHFVSNAADERRHKAEANTTGLLGR